MGFCCEAQAKLCALQLRLVARPHSTAEVGRLHITQYQSPFSSVVNSDQAFIQTIVCLYGDGCTGVASPKSQMKPLAVSSPWNGWRVVAAGSASIARLPSSPLPPSFIIHHPNNGTYILCNINLRLLQCCIDLPHSDCLLVVIGRSYIFPPIISAVATSQAAWSPSLSRHLTSASAFATCHLQQKDTPLSLTFARHPTSRQSLSLPL